MTYKDMNKVFLLMPKYKDAKIQGSLLLVLNYDSETSVSDPVLNSEMSGRKLTCWPATLSLKLLPSNSIN